MSELRKLVNLLSDSVDIIEASCAARGVSLPSINEPYQPESEDAYKDPKVLQAASLICSAANQLSLLTRPPKATLTMYMLQSLTTPALRAAMELHVPEILRSAGKNGLHVHEIASKAKTDSNKLSRVLRYLATQSVFVEVSPDVYANNCISTMFDKRQDIDALMADPASNFDNPESRWAAFIGMMGAESARSATYLYEHLADPSSASSGDPTKAAFNKAYDTDLSIWEMYELPGRDRQLKSASLAMSITADIDPIDRLFNSYNWENVPQGSKFVDVGGGIGTASKILAGLQSKLNIIVQDRPAVIEDGVKRWKEHSKEVIESGRVSFQAHDFMKPQPIVDASLFLLKAIIHDWSDETSRIILGHLRDAATPKSRLLIIDRIVPYACKGRDDVAEDIPGLIKAEVPECLPPNLGAWGPTPYHTDLCMLSLLNGQERTIGEWVRLLDSSRWKVVRVYQIDPFGALSSMIESVPA